MSDDQIVPYAGAAPVSAEVIDLDGIRIQWGLPAGRRDGRCKHKSMTYSAEEQRVWCQDCNRTIENFTAFMIFVRHYQDIERAARYKMQKADEAMKASLHRRATKAVDKAWSGNLCAIGCPHCGGGILPEDFDNGVMRRSSRELELERRKRLPPKGTH